MFLNKQRKLETKKDNFQCWQNVEDVISENLAHRLDMCSIHFHVSLFISFHKDLLFQYTV
jgi:hypothetical protein